VADILKMRAGQRRFMKLVDEYRLVAFLARRQYGKTTTFARIALRKMMRNKGHTIIFGSAKLNLSREIARKESEILQAAIRAVIQETARDGVEVVTVNDVQTGKRPDKLTPEDFAEMFEAQRLEFRFYHSRSIYSRTKVVALRPDAVGETGDLMADEIGRVGSWREVWEAISPIVASNPEFRLCLCTTPPPDDTHYSFEMLAPPVGTVFIPNKDGNIYRSDFGVRVLRLDAEDAYLDGVPIYDMEDGEALPPAEARRRDPDKDAWDRNYGCKFVLGGTGACGLMQLDTAQHRGIGSTIFANISCDEDFDQALDAMLSVLGPGKIGIGVDVATTTGGVSNPTSVTVTEQVGVDFIARAVIVWKTADPDVANDRIRRIVETVARRPAGGRARRLCVDATSERYFAVSLRKLLVGLVPVELVIASVTVDRPGYGSQTLKQILGTQTVDVLDNNRLTLPPDRYIRIDWRLVKKEKGLLFCEPDQDGKHGDTFDSTKLSIRALDSKSGVATIDTTAQVGDSTTELRRRDPRYKATWIDDNTPRERHMAG
jgi:hypothetical protein